METPEQRDSRITNRLLDGNAAAGSFTELFSVDVTAAVITCNSCGGSAPLGGHVLYADAPALVIRCPSCTDVVLRYGTHGGRLRLDLSGTRSLTLSNP